MLNGPGGQVVNFSINLANEQSRSRMPEFDRPNADFVDKLLYR